MTDDELMTLWLGSFRYHLGRQTYAVGMFCELLRKQWSAIPERCKYLIQKELETAIEIDAHRRAKNKDLGTFAWRQFTPLGGDIDHAEWMKVAALWRGNA